MAIVEIGSKVYNVPDQVASKLLDTSNKIEELEMEVRKLKKDVLDEEIHWHSQKQKRMVEKRKKLKYKQIINETIEYVHNHQLVFRLYSIEEIQEWFEKEYYVELLNKLKGE